MLQRFAAVTLLATVSHVLAAPLAAAEPQRTLRIDDLFEQRDVKDPRLSPDGRWVAYAVTRLDAAKDEADTDLYMAPLAGGEPVRLTSTPKSESRPRFSPDGRYLAFLSNRDGKARQVYLLDRRGGEARRLTEYKGGVSDLAWSPDGKRLALVVADEDPAAEDGDADEEPKPRPIAIRRRQFKQDGVGYLRELRDHVHVFDVERGKGVPLTSGSYDDAEPTWSPDGRLIAFVSKRTPEPDANENSDVFVVEASGGAPRAVTTWPGSDRSPAFTPDGRTLVYVQGGDPKDLWYGTSRLAAVAAAGGPARLLAPSLDRNVSRPRPTADGRVLFLLEDGGNSHLAAVALAGGEVRRIVEGERDVSAFDLGPQGALVVLESQVHQPPEVSAVTASGLRRVTRANDAWFAGIALAPVERLRAASPDGTPIDGFLLRPPSAPPGARLPTLLRLHGGPVDQFSTAFSFERQLLAAQGYAVVCPNPRGSSGYGRDFSRAIYADWGDKPFADVSAAVDAAVANGVADPDRLGVFGWSYGGILTNYVITRTARFRAAISGASEVNYLANYGTDHYQYTWEAELGLPWRATELWVRLSPFFEVDKVKTPTLVMCGSEDWNVPLLNSEQLYQALRRLGVETELVVYPGESHGIARPSFQKDRLERYLGWFDAHLKPQAVSLLGAPLYPPPLSGDQRSRLSGDLERAEAELAKQPESADALIWVGRRKAYLGLYREAIQVFTRGIEKFPEDVRFLRHRGHRYVTLRRFDEAIADLDRAAGLIRSRGLPDQAEPDGIPGPRQTPTSTNHFNVYYHLGLARYLKGDFEGARRAYEECLKYSGHPERLVATSDWLYMTLRRLGEDAEARALLEPIHAGLDVVEDRVYLDRLLMYKGEKRPEELLGSGGDDAVQLATYGYGVANHLLVNGQPERAREIFEKVASGGNWAAFGFIAAEAELARAGPTPEVVLENDQLRVLRVRYDAGQASALHAHPERVIVALSAARVRETLADGHVRELALPAGAVRLTPPLRHAVANAGARFETLEIELKPGAPPPAGTAEPGPPRRGAALEAESDLVRVYRARLGPRERVPLHGHGPRVLIALTDFRVRLTDPQGKTAEAKASAGQAFWREAGQHAEENLADAPGEAVTVELKAPAPPR